MLEYLLPILAVVIGVLFAYLIKKKQSFSTKLLLSFSGAFLLALTLFELLPEVYKSLGAKEVGILIMIGILIQIILEFFSKGVEHGHAHVSHKTQIFPWALFFSLCLHSLLEGLPIHPENSMVYGILVHKIPIAAVLATFLISSKFSKPKVIVFILIFMIMTPIGTYISNKTDLLTQVLPYLNAIVIGIFLHISTIILFENDKAHSFNLSKLISILLGIGVAYFI